MESRPFIPSNQNSIKKYVPVFFIIVLIPLLFSIQTYAQLSSGDIAFTGYNADGDDQFSFIATTNIAPNEIIYFTDRGYADEIPGWTTTEGIIKYIVPIEGLTSGDMIVLQYSSGWSIIIGSGIITSESGSLQLSTTGDQIFAFQTDDTENYTPSFIAGINMNNKTGATIGNWGNIDALNTSTNETDLPDDLINGTSAIWVKIGGENKNSKYNNTITQGLKNEIATETNKVVNWIGNDDSPYTLGYPTVTSTVTSGNWCDVATWDSTNGIPGKTSDVTINHEVAITADCTSNSTEISSNADLSVNSGKTFSCADTLHILSDASNSGSLIVDGSITGVISYKRYINGGRWYLVSPPVSGQSILTFLSNEANNIPQNGSNYGMMDYNTTSDNWNNYFTASTIDLLSSGKGYSLRRENEGTVSFSGTAVSTAINVSVSDAGNSWNLVGNPYPSAIKATETADATNNFLTINSSNFADSYTALYLWDEQSNYIEGRNDYRVINHAGTGTLTQDYLQATQGFFIKARTGTSSFSFIPEMRSNQTAIDFKSEKIPWPSLILSAHSKDGQTSTTFLFNKKMTNGLDIGYDAGILRANPNFSIYSILPENNGVEFMVQCLPNSFDEKIVIPIGIDAPELSKISFSIEKTNWEEDVSFLLEDKLYNTLTLFDNKNKKYETTLYNKGTGRFNLLVGKNISTGADKIPISVSIITKPSVDKIYITGQIPEKAQVTIFDLLGRTISTINLKNNQTAINFSGKKNGFYIIRIYNQNQAISKKINWIKNN